MKKRILPLLMGLIMGTLFLAGCSTSGETSNDLSSESSNADTVISSTSSEQTTVEGPTQTMSISEFENLLAEQPLYVSNTKYTVQNDTYKTLYPDMLQAILTNNTTEDIKDAVIAFVAWDSNNLPVKIEGQHDFSGGSYIQQVNYTDINLVGGDTFGENNGYSIKEDCKISTFKAVVVSFETFNGETWDNPYYDAFCSIYEGKKYSDDLTVEVKVVDSAFSASGTVVNNSVEKKDSTSMTADELEHNLSTQPVTIIKTEYVVQDARYKSLYPDMLQAVLQNNTTEDIKDAVVAFVAWDNNNLPVKIEGQHSFGDNSYVCEVNYSDINLAAGNTYGESSGYPIDENCNIATFKAIVVSYETFEGKTWNNPYYKDFCSLYEGKKLD